MSGTFSEEQIKQQLIRSVYYDEMNLANLEKAYKFCMFQNPRLKTLEKRLGDDIARLTVDWMFDQWLARPSMRVLLVESLTDGKSCTTINTTTFRNAIWDYSTEKSKDYFHPSEFANNEKNYGIKTISELARCLAESSIKSLIDEDIVDGYFRVEHIEKSATFTSSEKLLHRVKRRELENKENCKIEFPDFNVPNSIDDFLDELTKANYFHPPKPNTLISFIPYKLFKKMSQDQIIQYERRFLSSKSGINMSKRLVPTFENDKERIDYGLTIGALYKDEVGNVHHVPEDDDK
nr:hypothetical protein HAGR004_37770 [Bdellovibrio sp. HAGR004]